MGSGKAEATKNFVKEYPVDEIQQIVVDEHLTTKQMHNLENLAELPVIDRERLILEYAPAMSRLLVMLMVTTWFVGSNPSQPILISASFGTVSEGIC